MKNLLSCFLILSGFTFLYAQPNRKMQDGTGRATITGRIYGKIIDENTKEAIDYAALTLLLANRDSVISGGLTRANGDFSIEKIPLGQYRLRVQFVGYKTTFVPVTVSSNNLDQDIGNVSVPVDSKILKEVVIQDEKPTVIMGVDRRVYNVDRDISTKGGTGVDVMNNIPGLTVDADGNVSLRNNSPTVFIDGRPSVLTLEQLPADQIERVEVITNPSAKFDAGATGGIINVVMKKNTKPGYNGMLGANAGTNNRYGLNGNLNIKENPYNFFISYNLNHRENPTKGHTYRTNLFDGQPTGKYNQNSNSNRQNLMQFGRIGLDYNVSNRNTLTIAQNVMMGGINTHDDQTFIQTDGVNNMLMEGTRINDQENEMQNLTSQVMWKHTYPKQGKEWTADINAGFGKHKSYSTFETNNMDATGKQSPGNPLYQTNNGSGQNQHYTFQFDYTNPITDTARIEYGVRSNYKINRTGLDVINRDLTGVEIADTFLTSDYRINDLVNAVYINYTAMIWGIGYQAGLRFEQTHFTGSLVNRSQSFEYIYPDGISNIGKALFPSIFLSKKFNQKNELQVNFSRKINRPDWRQISPFIMFSDKQNYSIGNPALAPEFINLSEINYNYIFGFGSMLTSAYVRYQENPITNFVYRSQTDSNVLISSFINGNSNIAYGWENTLKFTFLKKKMDVSLNANVFHTNISAGALQNSGYSWNGKGLVSYKLPLQFAIQVNGSYEAPRIIPQGKTIEVYSVDVSLSKDIGKKLSLNITLNDVFNTRRFGSFFDTELFTQDLMRRRESRFLRVGLTWRFGEWDTSLFRRKSNKRGENPNMDQMDF